MINKVYKSIGKRRRDIKNDISLFETSYLQHKFALPCIEKYLKNIESGIICDFGCGDKPFQGFCKKEIIYVGIDIDTGNDKADIFASVCEKIPLKDEFSDYCLSFFVLEHVEEPQKQISEMYRILKKRRRDIYVNPTILGRT